MKIGSSVTGRRDSYIIKNTRYVISKKRLDKDVIKKTYANLKKAAENARDRTTLDAIQEVVDGLANRLAGTKYQESSGPMYFEVIEAIKERDDELRTVHDAKSGHAEIHGTGGGLSKEKDQVPPPDYAPERPPKE